MDDDLPAGDLPAPWRPESEPEAGSSPGGGLGERWLGAEPGALNRLVRVTDDLTALLQTVGAGDLPFNGAYVPLVVHDSILAERSYDAGEWSADLIRSAGGRVLVLAPYAEDGWTEQGQLSARQWNHTAAMIERLETVCRRFAIDLELGETVGGQPVDDRGHERVRSVHHLLDAGHFVADGYRPVRLRCPVADPPAGGLVGRVRGILRDLT